LHELPEDMGRHSGERDHGRGEGRPDLRVHVRERPRQHGKQGGPTDVGHAFTQLPGFDLREGLKHSERWSLQYDLDNIVDDRIAPVSLCQGMEFSRVALVRRPAHYMMLIMMRGTDALA